MRVHSTLHNPRQAPHVAHRQGLETPRLENTRVIDEIWHWKQDFQCVSQFVVQDVYVNHQS